MSQNAQSALQTVLFLLESPKPILKSAMFCLGVMLVLGASYVAIYCLMLSIMNGTASYGKVTTYAFVIILCIIAFYCLNRLLYKNAFQTGYTIAAGIRTRLSKHLCKLPLSFFKKNDTSKISGCFLHDMTDTESVFCSYIHEILSYGTIIFIYGILFLIMDFTLGFIILSTSLMTFSVIIYASREIEEKSKEFVQVRSLTDKTILEYISGIGELKAAHMTGKKFTPWSEANAYFRNISLAMETRFGILVQIYMALLDLSFVIMLFAGTWLVSGGNIQLSIFLFFLLLSGKFYQPMQDIGCYISEFRFALASLRRIEAVLVEKSLPQHIGYTSPIGYNIAFENVRFTYESSSHQVLENVSFTVKEGTVTALVGVSGSGKTTTANLLLRFWDVDNGCISIGGTDIRTFSSEEFYKLFSVVFQDAYLFNDTVMNNLRFAKQCATDEEIFEAAKKACCHDFIISLKQGYNTVVGEKGSCLSGGERQRLAIARAILKDAPIIILDEATSSIDPQNELLIQQGLTNLLQGKTLLVIAHRLSTIKGADQILVLQKGHIAEKGTHTALLNEGGVYANLWHCQEKMKSWSVK